MRRTVTLISSRSHGHQPPNQPGQPEPTRTTRACLLEFHCLHYRHSENKPPPNHDDYLKNLPLCKWENQKLKTWGYIVGSEARTQIKALAQSPVLCFFLTWQNSGVTTATTTTTTQEDPQLPRLDFPQIPVLCFISEETKPCLIKDALCFRHSRTMSCPLTDSLPWYSNTSHKSYISVAMRGQVCTLPS